MGYMIILRFDFRRENLVHNGIDLRPARLDSPIGQRICSVNTKMSDARNRMAVGATHD